MRDQGIRSYESIKICFKQRLKKESGETQIYVPYASVMVRERRENKSQLCRTYEAGTTDITVDDLLGYAGGMKSCITYTRHTALVITKSGILKENK